MRSRSLLGLTALATLAACASTANRFPTRDELTRLQQAPPPARVFDRKQQDPDRWELEGPLATAADVAAYRGATEWEKLLDEFAAGRAGLLFPSQSMHCVAHETGRYYLAKDAQPGERLARFIATRCGSMVARVETAWLSGDAPDDVTEAQVLAKWREDARGLIAKTARGNREAGVWFGRAGKRAVLVIAASERRALVDAVPLVPEGGAVHLRGEVLVPVGSVRAIVNRGAHGFARCTVDEKVVLPRFDVKCEVDPQDAGAWVELAAFPPGRILGHSIVEVLAFPSGNPGSVFELAPRGAAAATGSGAVEQLAAAVNQARAEAGLQPLTLSLAESRVAGTVAPHYFAALLGEEPETVADTVALGLRAGWEVDGEVRQGGFISGLTVGADDPDALVRSVVELPGGREVLLDPDARTLAIGPIVDAGKALAAVFGAYALFDGNDHGGDVQRVLTRLVEERGKRNLPPPAPIAGMSHLMSEASRKLTVGGGSPSGVLQDTLDDAVHALNRPVRGWYFEANDLADLKLPDDILGRPSLQVAIGVSHHRPHGEPWVRYVVFVIIAEPGTGGNSAI